MSLRIPEFGPTTQGGTKTDRGMIWLILGFFLQGFCSLPYLNTSLVGSSTKGQAWFSFILEPWHVFNQVNPTELQCRAQNGTKSCTICTVAVCAGRVRGFVAKVCILQNNCHSPASPPTFALSAAIQMWIGKNIPERAKKLQKIRRRKCWKMRCKGGLLPSGQRARIVWAEDIVSDLFVITRN